ncbi:hypothetical protein IF2G_03071 [Cordyceps javanica]|nr:hypothetical protein IF2G_03071 [Cordyceps javanica]
MGRGLISKGTLFHERRQGCNGRTGDEGVMANGLAGYVPSSAGQRGGLTMPTLAGLQQASPDAGAQRRSRGACGQVNQPVVQFNLYRVSNQDAVKPSTDAITELLQMQGVMDDG